jgi:UDP-N-acetylmuramyl tripeptide synthase
MATKKTLRYTLIMEFNPDEDQLEFIEERMDALNKAVELVKVEKLTRRELMRYLAGRDDIAVA